jgi:hypothetical protein
VTHYIPLQASTSLSSIEPIAKETPSYFVDRLGGVPGQAQLYLEAGLLHLEGAASLLLSSSSTALSSLRSSEPYHALASRESGTEGWRRDRETARRYFERAKILDPTIDVPVLPSEGDESTSEKGRRSIEVRSTAPSTSGVSRASSQKDTQEKDAVAAKPKRRRKEKDGLEDSLLDHVDSDLWYLYLPGVVGAVIAVGIVGALSLTSWRKSQA